MQKKHFLIITVLITGMLLLGACSNAETTPDTQENVQNPAELGAELFAQSVFVNQTGCSTCHSREEGEVIVGPSMFGIASRAGNTVPGLSAEEYLRQSILDPDAYLVDDYPPGTMPQTWNDNLSTEQVDALVAYLLTLK